MFFSGWSSLIHVLLVGVPAFVALVALLRAGGKRSLSKFNGFDLVVTVAFGSTLASALVTPELTLAEVVAAFALLVLLQFVFSWAAMRWRTVGRIVKGEPQLLYLRGEYLHEAMARERVGQREIFAAVREHGRSGIENVEAVILETDGSISVISRSQDGMGALEDVRGYPM